MNTNINFTINLDFVASDQIKLKMEYVVPDESYSDSTDDSSKEHIVPLETVEEDEELNTKFFEIGWTSFAHVKLIPLTVGNVKRITRIYIYILYRKHIYKYIFEKGLDNVNDFRNFIAVDISIHDGHVSSVTGDKPSILINKYGPIIWEYMYSWNIWCCWYCGLEKAIDIKGTRSDRCNIL